MKTLDGKILSYPPVMQYKEKKIVDYTIMWGTCAHALVREVRKGLSEGWGLHGVMCEAQEEIDGELKPSLNQAMVKYEEND